MRIRILGLTGLIGLAVALMASPASAAPSDPDSAASSSLSAVDSFFGRDGSAPAQSRIVGDPVARYELNPAFVTSASAPIALLQGMASTAVAADGRTASVWTARTSSGSWAVVNIASGSDERDYVLQGAGGLVFTEPQINAWYVVRGTTVYPLNADARSSIGVSVSVAGYQKMVRSRYADKLPGSAYDRKGTAGGYSMTPARSSPWPGIGVGVGALILMALFIPNVARRRSN